MNRYIFALLLVSLPATALGDKPQAPTAEECYVRYSKKQFSEALSPCTQAAEAGDLKAQFTVGEMYADGDGVSKDLDVAFGWYMRAAEKGHARSQQRIAVAYAFGLGGAKKDEAKAVEWLKRAAEGGDKRAQKQLADGYARGWFGLPQDDKLAQKWRDIAEKNSY